MTVPTIRKATSGDAAGLADLILGLEWFGRYFEGLSLEAARAQVDRHLGLCLGDENSHTVFVAQDAGSQLIAYAAVHWLPYLFLPGPEGYISELFVTTDARGQGVGRRLLEAVMEEAKAHGCSRLSLINMRGRESYQRGFYHKQGWNERADAANFVVKLEP